MGYTELLKNGSANSFDTSGWNVTAAGNGWIVDKDGYSGKNCFVTSFDICKKSQEVDLFRAGLTKESMKQMPAIVASVFVRGTGPNFSDSCYVIVQLLGEDKQVLAEWNTGAVTTSSEWQELSHTFTNYSEDVRYVYWEDGGRDAEFWHGHYGARFSCASLKIDFEKPIIHKAEPLNVEKQLPSSHVLEIIEKGDPFIDSEFPHSNASIGNENASGIEWIRARDLFGTTPELFKDGTDANDIEQGSLGNCWFMSALASLAQNNYYLKYIFLNDTFNEAGIYELLLYKGGLPCRVIVDEYLPCMYGVPCFCKPKGNELWTVLLEKAYAKMNGSYQRLTEGCSENAFQDLTGCPIACINLTTGEARTSIKSGDMFREIQKYCELGYMIATSSNCSPDVLDSNTTILSNGIVFNHAYSILAAKQIGKVQLIQLRNPWSRDVWTGPYNDNDTERWTEELKNAVGFQNADDGCFWMSFEDYVQQFWLLSVAFSAKNMQNFRAQVEYNSTNLAVSYYITTTEPDTNLHICTHQTDKRIPNTPEYTCNGALLIDNYTQKVILDTGSWIERGNCAHTIVDPGTYIVIPYAFGPCVSALSVHSDKPFIIEKEQDLFSFAKSIDIYEKIAEYCVNKNTESLDFVEKYTNLRTIALKSYSKCTIVLRFNVMYCSMISPYVQGDNNQTVTVTLEPGKPKFAARFTHNGWNFIGWELLI